jgi:hypothetical protein
VPQYPLIGVASEPKGAAAAGRPARWASAAVLPALLVASLCANVLLVQKLRTSEQRLLVSTRLTTGEVVPAITARLEDGSLKVLNWSGTTDTVFYYFDPGCSWCRRNGPAFAGLLAGLRPGIRVYSYTSSLSGLEAFRRGTHHAAVVITDDKIDVKRTLRLWGTPQTLVIDGTGRVVKNWEGAYSGTVRSEIQDYFHVTVPEILPAQLAQGTPQLQ